MIDNSSWQSYVNNDAIQLETMRNLALISSWDSFLPSSSSSITATTIDLDENVIYVASENTTLDGQVQVDVWKMNQSERSIWVFVH
jgi:hypothetical protein